MTRAVPSCKVETTFTSDFVSHLKLLYPWNRQRATLADAALRNKGVTSTLRKTLMNDQFYAEKNCGSPKAFFEPYLR